MSNLTDLFKEHPLPWTYEVKPNPRRQAQSTLYVYDAERDVVISEHGSEDHDLLRAKGELIVNAANQLATPGSWVPLRPMSEVPEMYGLRSAFAVSADGLWRWVSQHRDQERWRDDDFIRIEDPLGWIDLADLPKPVTE